jgi:hypothetical protein
MRLRVTTDSETRTLALREFAEEVLEQARRGGAEASMVPVLVEYLGEDDRVHWQAHHRVIATLTTLAQELLEDADGKA